MPIPSTVDSDSSYDSWQLWMRILSALLGPLQFGIAMAVMNTMLDSISSDLGFDKSVGGAVATSALYLGCGIGSCLSGLFQTGLKNFSQSGVAVLFFCGSLLCGFTNSDQWCWGGSFDGCVPYLLLIGRIINGFAGGICVVISPKYLAELAPSRHRMSLCTVFEICFVAGTVVGLVIGLPYEFNSFDIGYAWWRIMFLIGSFPAILQISFEFTSLVAQRTSSSLSMDAVYAPLTESTEVWSTKSSAEEDSPSVLVDLDSETFSEEEEKEDASWTVLFEKNIVIV